MLEMIQIKKGFFHKFFATVLAIALYFLLAWNSIVLDKSFGDPFYGLHIIGNLAFFIVNLPIVFYILMYIVYGIFSSKEKTFTEWVSWTMES